MKVIKIRMTSLTRLRHDEFWAKGKTILQQFKNHSSELPSPPVSVTALEDALNDLKEKTILASSTAGSANDRNARAVQAAVVLNMLLQNSAYVLMLANAKATMQEKIALVHLAGYPVANETYNPVSLEPIKGVKATTSGIPGISVVSLRWKRGNAKSFLIQTTQGDISEPSTVWKNTQICTTSKFQLTLSPGTWSIRVIGLGSKSTMAPPSAAVHIVVG